MEQRAGEPGGERTGRREVALALALALGLRVLAILAFQSPEVARGATAWAWGQEPACIAEALARGDGFADPWGRGTGPTGWLTPVYPGLLAGLMALFDGVGPRTAWALYLLQSALSALTAPLVLLLGRRLGGERAGRLGMWLFALHPLAIWNAAAKVWDTTLVEAGLAALLLLVLRGGRGLAPGRAALLGLAYGALLLVNPAPVALAPAVVLYACLGPGRGAARAAASAGALAAGALVACAPWIARNALVLGSPGLRTNLGVELRVGNNDEADGMHVFAYHPGWEDALTARYREQGEVAFARAEGAAARRWIAAHPGRFLGLALRRIGILWLGLPPPLDRRTFGGLSAARDPKSWGKWLAHLALGLAALAGLATRRGRGQWNAGTAGNARAALVAASLVLFSLPYAATHALERYRLPLDPLCCVLAAGALLALRERWAARRGDATGR